MREPVVVYSDGTRTPFSRASCGDLRAMLDAGAVHGGIPELPPDIDFRRWYASYIISQRP